MTVADLERALSSLVAALGPAREAVAAVGLTGMAESGAPFLAGRPVGPIIAWHDGRGVETVASLERRFGPDLPRRTGRRLRTVSSVAKLGWLLDHGCPSPDRWLGVPELALRLLTGSEATEHSLAARTGAYDVIERRFLPEVIAHVLAPAAHTHQPGAVDRLAPAPPAVGAAGEVGAAGVGGDERMGAVESAGGGEPPGGDHGRRDDEPAVGTARARGGEWADVVSESDTLFPPVRAAGTAMGFVSGSAAAAFGLPAGIPVTIAGHDHLAGAAGLGARPDDLLNSVGTAETLLRRLDSPPDVERALELNLAVTVWPGGDAWGVLASAARSGLVIEALAAHLGTEPAVPDDLVTGTVADPSGVAAQEKTPPGQTDRAGAGVEGPCGQADRAGVGVEGPGGRGAGAGERVALGQGIEVAAGPPAAMWSDTLEALARRTAAAAERVAALAGPHRRLVVFGGGSRSRAWAQAKEVAVGVPVVRCPVPEAAARGAALAAGVAAGWWPIPAAGPTPLPVLGSDGCA